MYLVFSIKLRQVMWICKDKTYNCWNDMGEALQWGKVCNGFSAPLQIFQGEGLQYNTGTNMSGELTSALASVSVPALVSWTKTLILAVT